MIDFAALKRANAPLHAFLDFDEKAKAGTGSLEGVTIGVKANIAVRGLPWHGGLEGLKDRIASDDAATVKKLREAGAQIIGTLNMEEAALGSKTDNPFFGATQNPHRFGYSPGGSSGGSAAAVAAGLCDGALGTDTMGSVRIPAAHCGIYGFKPATGRVSQDGLEPADMSLDAIGPLARDLDTLEKIARVMSDLVGEASDDRGATLTGHCVDLHTDVEKAFNEALSTLRQPPLEVKLNHKLSRIRFAGFIHVAKAMAEHLAEVPKKSEHLQRLIAYGPNRRAHDWADDQAILADTRHQMRAMVEQNGWTILPTAPNPAFPHSEREPAAQADFTCLANIAGLPAISLPAGWTGDGLPIGVQIIGRAGFEVGLFALARHLDTRLNAYQVPKPSGE